MAGPTSDAGVLHARIAELERELGERNREVREALEQQTAMAEVLSIIAGAALDAQPVFDAIVERGAALCDAHACLLTMIEGEYGVVVAQSVRAGPGDQYPDSVPLRGSVVGEVLASGNTVHIFGSTQETAARFPAFGAALRGPNPWSSQRLSVLVIPLRQKSEVVGVVATFRNDGIPFTSGQVATMETFADQAVIAIENARLFNELQESNRELSSALERQTATSAVLETISRSPTNLQSVLDTIVRNAVGLMGDPLRATFSARAKASMRPWRKRVKGPPLRLVLSSRPASNFRSTTRVRPSRLAGNAEPSTFGEGRQRSQKNTLAQPPAWKKVGRPRASRCPSSPTARCSASSG